MRSIVLSLSLLGVLLGGCSVVGTGGGDYFVRGEIGSLSLEPDGEFGLANGVGVSVTGIDLEALGLDDRQSEAYAKASFRLGSSELSLSAFQTEFSGSGTLPVTFGSITATTAVTSEMDITNAKFLWRWYLVDMDFLSIGPGLGVDYMDMKAKIASGALTEDFDVQAPIPMPGISAEVRLGPVSAYADAYGLSVNQGDADGTFLDLEGGVRFKPFPFMDASAGYRMIQFEAKGDDGSQSFDADYKLPGLFFSVAIRF